MPVNFEIFFAKKIDNVVHRVPLLPDYTIYEEYP